MKKAFISVFTLCLSMTVFGQNTQIQNKKGKNIMPEKGHVAIGVNALPVLSFVGDIFGYNQSNQSL